MGTAEVRIEAPVVARCGGALGPGAGMRAGRRSSRAFRSTTRAHLFVGRGWTPDLASPCDPGATSNEGSGLARCPRGALRGFAVASLSVLRATGVPDDLPEMSIWVAEVAGDHFIHVKVAA
jgi:hypothetical protein